MKKPILFSLLLCMGTAAAAQNLIPFVGPDHLYGYMDPAGKVVTQPQFKNAWISRPDGLTIAIDTLNQTRVIRQDGAVLPEKVNNRNPYLDPQVYHAINLNMQTGQEDTIPNVFCIRNADNGSFMVVYNSKAGWTAQSGLYYGDLKSTIRSYGNYVIENYSGSLLFHNGLMRIIKGPNQVNFINTELKELLKTDAENGVILKNGSIAIANADGRFALADHTGKQISPFIYTNLIGTNRDDYFIVNYKPDQTNRNAGMIRKDGSLVLDTVYSILTAATDKLIIAQKDYDNRYKGLMDYSGKTVLPFEYDNLEYATNGLFIASKNTEPGFNIIRADGTPLVDANKEYIRFHKNYSKSHGTDYFEVKNAGAAAVLDQDARMLFSGNLGQIRMENFGFRVSDPSNINWGVYSFSGRAILQPVFQKIDVLSDGLGFLVEKDSLCGFYSSTGDEMLSCKFHKMVQEKTGDTYILWSKAQKDKHLYTPFTLQGERLPIADQIAPTMQALKMKTCFFPQMENGQWKLILPDGSSIIKARDYPYNNINVGTPDGCLMVEKENGYCKILDAWFKPIIPKGFWLPEKYYRGPYLQMGLIPVYNDYQSGIINTKGEWVKKPGEFGYHILGPAMYSEHKGQPMPMSPDGITIYTITPEGTQKMALNYMDDKFKDGLLVVGKLFKDAPKDVLEANFYAGGVFKYALMDTTGALLTPFMLKRHQYPNGQRWATRIYTGDYQEKNVILDEKGKIVFEFGPEPISGYDNTLHWIYFDTPEHFTGARDTLGNEVLPPTFRNMYWLFPGRMFVSELPGGGRQMFDKNGKALTEPFKYYNRYQQLRDGYIYVVTDETCLVFSPENKIIASLPGNEASMDAQYPDLIVVETADRKKQYVNIKKGVVYANN